MKTNFRWMPTLAVALAILLALGGVALAKGGKGRDHDRGRSGWYGGGQHRTTSARWYAHRSHVRDLKFRSKRHREHLKDLWRRGVRVKERLADHETRITALETRIDEVAAEIVGVADSINALNDQITALSSDTEANAIQIGNLQGSVDALQMQLTQAEQELNALYASLAAEVGDARTALDEHIAESEVVNAEVQGQITDLQAQIDAINDSLVNDVVTVEDLAQLTVDLASLTAEVAGLTASINANTTEILGLQTATSELSANQYNHVHVVRYVDKSCIVLNCTNNTRVAVSETGQLP